MVKRNAGTLVENRKDEIMPYCFDAIHVFTQDDGCMVMIGLADDELEPSRYVLLQRAHEYDAQDKKMGMDKIHIQVEDESRSLYGGINAIQVDNGAIRFSLSDEAKSVLSIDTEIEAICSAKQPRFDKVKAQLKRMCEAEGVPFSE